MEQNLAGAVTRRRRLQCKQGVTNQVQVGDCSVKAYVDHLLSSNVEDRTDAMDSTMANDFAPDVSDKGNSSVSQPHVPVETGTVSSPERRYPL